MLSIIATVVAALIGALIPTLINNIKDRKSKRINPSIALWNNSKDDIDKRLENNNLYWFIDIDKIEEYATGKYLYLVLRSENKFKMSDCKVKITIVTWDKHNKSTKTEIPEYKLGMIISLRSYILPISINGDRMEILCDVNYRTEGGELKQYNYYVDINSISMYLNERKASSEVVGKYKIKRKEVFDLDLTESYTSNEVKQRLGKRSLNYNLDIKGEDKNGYNIAS